jgi:hypothetical protein
MEKKMKLICSAAMITVVLVSSAEAQSTSTTTCKDDFYTGHTCTTTASSSPANPEPQSARQLSREEERKFWAGREANIRKWEAYCRPTRHIDNLGVTRLHYAHVGCDVGRTESDEAVASADAERLAAADAERYGSKTTSAADTGTTRRTQ